MTNKLPVLCSLLTSTILLVSGCLEFPREAEVNPAAKSQQFPRIAFNTKIGWHSRALFSEGKAIFRFDTFGSEFFWGDQLRLHEAIAGERYGGVGPGLTPRQALALGLKVDSGLTPAILAQAIAGGSVSFDSPKTTLELLRAGSVIGVKASFEGGQMKRVGITCAICHSTVDNSLARGIGRRLDGWPNRDLNIGAIINLAPNLRPMADAMHKDEASLRNILASWGPGKYDAELNIDGKGFQPNGRSAATLIPAAYGLAGQNLHTYTGWGGVPYWNSYVANLQMHGSGTHVDQRMNRSQFPLAQSNGMYNTRNSPDLITAKLPALQFYQLAIPAPQAPDNYYDHALAAQGKAIFEVSGKCASCHVPPLFSEPGWPMHTGAEIGIDDFQANRSPDKRYRTTPLTGLFVKEKGGFYHDGRFKTLRAVVDHYERPLKISLTEADKTALVEYLKSL
jgi:hypothetical protein